MIIWLILCGFILMTYLQFCFHKGREVGSGSVEKPQTCRPVGAGDAERESAFRGFSSFALRASEDKPPPATDKMPLLWRGDVSDISDEGGRMGG